LSCYKDPGNSRMRLLAQSGYASLWLAGCSVRRGLRDNIFLHIAFLLVCSYGVHYAGLRVQTAYMGNYEVQCAQQVLLEENGNWLWMQARLWFHVALPEGASTLLRHIEFGTLH
jgi:hypothetical protein